MTMLQRTKDATCNMLQGKCCGCGVKLQSDDPLVVGYTSSEQLQSSEQLLAQVQA